MKTISQTATVESRVCCITGGARGIGAALVSTFCDAGFRVVFTYRSGSSDEKAAALARQGRVIAVKCDSGSEDGAHALLSAAIKAFGRADVLINNAGSSLYKLVQDTSMTDYDKAIEDNLTSVFVNGKAFAKHFVSRGSGKIINISSVWGVRGGALESVYSAAKAGVIGFTKSLAKELAPSGITVNAIAPGVINTDMLNGFSSGEIDALTSEIPLGRLGSPQDVASAALYLANAHYITGQILNVNGGM